MHSFMGDFWPVFWPKSRVIP